MVPFLVAPAMALLPATPIMHSWSLPMMPTLLDDVLLPGERSRLLLKEPAHLALLKAALEEQGGFFGLCFCSRTAGAARLHRCLRSTHTPQ